MENTALIIQGTPGEIADGLKRFADLHAAPTPEPDFHDEIMTVEKAAEFMQVHYETLCKYIKQGKVRIYIPGKPRKILRSELIEDFKNMK